MTTPTGPPPTDDAHDLDALDPSSDLLASEPEDDDPEALGGDADDAGEG